MEDPETQPDAPDEATRHSTRFSSLLAWAVSRSGRRRLLALLLLGIAGGIAAWLLPPKTTPQAAPEAHEIAPTASAPGPERTRLHGERVLHGTVRDDQEKPLEGAWVRIRSLDEPTSLPWELQTDVDGHFMQQDLPRHELAVSAALEGHDGAELTITRDDTTAPQLVLTRQGELEVSLVEKAGQSVEGAEVFLTGSGLWPAAQERAEATNHVVFRGLPQGSYHVRARHGARVAETEGPLNVVPGKRARAQLRFHPGYELALTVMDRQTNKPIEGARVAIEHLTPGIPADVEISDQAGQVQRAGLWGPSVRITSSHPGHAPASQELSLPQGARTVVQLDGAARLEGLVSDARGRPIEGALVSVSTPEGLPVELAMIDTADRPSSGELGVTEGPVPEIPTTGPSELPVGSLAARSNEHGRFAIDGLPPLPITVSALRAGYVPTAQKVTNLAPHATRADLAIVMREAGRVHGEVRDARGKPLANIHVTYDSKLLGERAALSDEDGAFDFQDLLGAVTIRAQAPGLLSTPCQVVVEPGRTAHCVIAVGGELHRLNVRVTDSHGAVLPGAQVSVEPEPPGLRHTRLTGPSGEILFGELAPPPYTLEVRLKGYVPSRTRQVGSSEDKVLVTLAQAATLQGVVMDVAGYPVPHALVAVEPGEASTQTRDDGTFRLDGVAAGVVITRATHPATGDGESREVRARPGQVLGGIRIILAGRYRPAKPAAERNGGRADAAQPLPQHEPAEPARATAAVLDLDRRGSEVVVSGVRSGGVAAKAGLRVGDRIVSVDGERALSAAHARGLLRDPAGTTARVRVRRGASQLTLRYARPRL